MRDIASRIVICLGAFLFSMSVLSISGCGGSAGPVPTVKVKVALTLDGKPFGPARLVLKPNSPESPHPTGSADAAGDVILTTFSLGDGVPVGTYKVALSPDPTIQTPEHPQVYNDSENSPLTLTIAEGGSNEFKLDMNSSAGPAVGGAAGSIPSGINLPPGFDPSKAYGPVGPPPQK